MPAAFITGGSSGIGFAAAWELAIKGYSLALFARDAAKLLAARDALLEAAPDIEVEQYPADVIAGRDPQLEKAIEIVLEELKRNPPKKYRKPPYPVRARP